jgi:hypothetical protein
VLTTGGIGKPDALYRYLVIISSRSDLSRLLRFSIIVLDERVLTLVGFLICLSASCSSSPDDDELMLLETLLFGLITLL